MLSIAHIYFYSVTALGEADIDVPRVMLTASRQLFSLIAITACLIVFVYRVGASIFTPLLPNQEKY